MAVGDRLPLHRQLHLDARLCLCTEDGHAHALLHACSEHGGCCDQVTPERRERAGGVRLHRKSRGGTAEGEVVAGDKVEVKGQRTKRHQEDRGQHME